MNHTNFILDFNTLCLKTYKGIRGVELFDSGKPGPTLGITIQTHGNEPVGLAVYPYLKEVFASKHGLLKGRVFIVLNNLRASRRYFEAMNRGDKAKMEKARFVDVNMNRLPTKKLDDPNCKLYEVRRTRELMPIWKQFDYGLDLHSTSQKSNPMIVALDRSDLGLIDMLPFTDVISNIESVQIGTPACALYGSKKSSIFGLEAGQHTGRESFRKAKLSVQVLLGLLGMVKMKEYPKKSRKDVYRVFDSIIPTDRSFKLAKTFKTYEKISKGQLMAFSHAGDIIAQEDCLALFGRDSKLEVHLNEEALFLAKKL